MCCPASFRASQSAACCPALTNTQSLYYYIFIMAVCCPASFRAFQSAACCPALTNTQSLYYCICIKAVCWPASLRQPSAFTDHRF